MDGYCAGCPGGYRIVVLYPVISPSPNPGECRGSFLVGHNSYAPSRRRPQRSCKPGGDLVHDSGPISMLSPPKYPGARIPRGAIAPDTVPAPFSAGSPISQHQRYRQSQGSSEVGRAVVYTNRVIASRENAGQLAHIVADLTTDMNEVELTA